MKPANEMINAFIPQWIWSTRLKSLFKGLGFLSDTFTFWKAQMEVFYERLKSTMSDISAPPEEEEG